MFTAVEEGFLWSLPPQRENSPLLGPPPPTPLFPSLVPLFCPSLSLPLPTYSPCSLSNLFVLFPGRSLPPPCPLLFPFWLELLVPLLCPPSFPLLLLFSSFLHFWIVLPLFSLALCRGPSDSQMVKPKKKEGGGGRVCRFSSFPVICLCLSLGLCFLSPTLICSL